MGNLARKQAFLLERGMQAAKLDLAGDSGNLASLFSSTSLPHRLLCIMLLLPQNMFLGVSSVVTMATRCRKGWWLLVWWTNVQQHSIAVIYVSIFCYIIKILSGNFYGLEIWHKIFGGLNFGPGMFFWILFEALGILGVLIFAANYPCHFKSRVLPPPPSPVW